MTRLVFHIGHRKTGSTALQSAFAASRARLAARGVLYPEPPHSVNHRALKAFFREGGAADATAAARWEAIVAEVRAAAPQTVVLSAEGFFRPMTGPEMARLVAELGRIAGTVEIVAYVRSPASYFLSSTQQHLKRAAEIRIPSPTRCRDALEPYLLGGPGRVIVRAFERDRLVGGDILADFCAAALPELAPADFDAGAGEANVTVSAEAMALLQEANAGAWRGPGRAPDLSARRLGDLIRRADRRLPGGTRPRLHAEVEAAIAAQAADLGWLAETFGVTFADAGPPAMDPAMDPAAAAARLRRIATVADMCPVDRDREAALRATVAAAARARANPLRRLVAALRRG